MRTFEVTASDWHRDTRILRKLKIMADHFDVAWLGADHAGHLVHRFFVNNLLVATFADVDRVVDLSITKGQEEVFESQPMERADSPA